VRPPQAPSPLPDVVRQLFLGAPGGGAPPASGAGWHRGRAGSIANAAVVEVWLQLAADGRVVALRYRAWGCPYTIAALAWLAQRWPGDLAAELPAGGPAGWQAALGVPVERLGRLLIVEDALRAALGAPMRAPGA
jgi:hypothetical protein